jgi:rhomboid protease GluP
MRVTAELTEVVTAAPAEPNSRWKPASDRFRAAPVSHVLIAACVILYALGEFWGQGSPVQNWLMGANNGRAVREGEWYRLGAATFLHGSMMHLFMNMMGVWALSGLERLLGPGRFFLL